MRVCIRRGSREIGGSCVELEQDGRRLLLDLGLPLGGELEDRSLLPVVPGLEGDDAGLLGILISHPHLDHFGLLNHVSPKVPVGMGPAARRILAAAAPFLPREVLTPAEGWDYQSGRTFSIGPFRITPYLVDHSAYDAYSLVVEAGGRRVFYSGDFRGHGRKAALFARMLANPPTPIHALLLEGSSLERLDADEVFPSETDIETRLIGELSATKGLALIHTSAQNIDRLVSIFRAAKKSGRKMLVDLYAASILAATENRQIPQSDWEQVGLLVPQSQRILIARNEWFDRLQAHSAGRVYFEDVAKTPEKYALLFRPLYQSDLERAGCLKDARYIYSQWEGYWDGDTYESLREWLAVHGIPKVSVHTSGHASPVHLKALVSALAPDRVVPIHSFVPERYPALFPRVEPHGDGEWWEV